MSTDAVLNLEAEAEAEVAPATTASSDTILNPLTEAEVAQIRQQYRDSEIIQSLFQTHAGPLMSNPIVIKNKEDLPIELGTFVANSESPVPPFYLPTNEAMAQDTFVSNMCFDRMQPIKFEKFIQHEWQNSILTLYSHVMNLRYRDDNDNDLLQKLCRMKNMHIIQYLLSKWEFYQQTGSNTPSEWITDLDDKFPEAHLYNVDMDNSYQFTLRLSLNDFHLVRSYINLGLTADEQNINYSEHNRLMDYLLSQHECTKTGHCERSHARQAFALPLALRETQIVELLTNLNNFRKLNVLIKKYPPIQSPNGLYVYRGQPCFDECTTWSVGHEFTVGRITSTSYTSILAFVSDETNVPYVRWKILLPQGFPLAFVQQDEGEVLLPIGTVLQYQGYLDEEPRVLQFKAIRIMALPKNLRDIFDNILIDIPGDTSTSNLEKFGIESQYISMNPENNKRYRQTLADSDPGNFGGKKPRKSKRRRRRKTRKRKTKSKSRRRQRR